MRDGYLIEWWSPPVDRTDPVGRWAFAGDAAAARSTVNAVPIPDIWHGAVRITLMSNGGVTAAIATDLDQLLTWCTATDAMPAAIEGLVLPPKAQGEVRIATLSACGEALGVALRSKLLSRRQLGQLLVTIDRAFEAHQLERVQSACRT